MTYPKRLAVLAIAGLLFFPASDARADVLILMLKYDSEAKSAAEALKLLDWSIKPIAPRKDRRTSSYTNQMLLRLSADGRGLQDIRLRPLDAVHVDRPLDGKTMSELTGERYARKSPIFTVMIPVTQDLPDLSRIDLLRVQTASSDEAADTKTLGTLAVNNDRLKKALSQAVLRMQSGENHAR